jgi:hypothetical protein
MLSGRNSRGTLRRARATVRQRSKAGWCVKRDWERVGIEVLICKLPPGRRWGARTTHVSGAVQYPETKKRGLRILYPYYGTT